MTSSTHRMAVPEPQTVKIWIVDAGVVLERIALDFGGLKSSYLGPPENYRGK